MEGCKHHEAIANCVKRNKNDVAGAKVAVNKLRVEVAGRVTYKWFYTAIGTIGGLLVAVVVPIVASWSSAYDASMHRIEINSRKIEVVLTRMEAYEKQQSDIYNIIVKQLKDIKQKIR